MSLDAFDGVRLDLVLRATDTKRSAEHRLVAAFPSVIGWPASDFIAAQMEPVRASRTVECDIPIG